MKIFKRLLCAAAVALAGAYAFGDSTTSRFGMTVIDVGSTNWGPKLNTNTSLIDNAAGIAISNVFTSSQTFNNAVGITGALTQSGGTAALSSTTVSGQFVVQQGLLSQSGGTATLSTTTVTGSITARNNMTVNANGSTLSYFQAGGNSTGLLMGQEAGSGGGNIITGSSASDYVIAGASTNNMRFGNNNSIAMTIDSTGRIVQPLQPGFLALGSGSDQTNATGDGTEATVTYGTEVYDTANNFVTSTFTAPVAGKYLFTVNAKLTNMNSAYTTMRVKLTTTNRDYFAILDGTTSITGLPLSLNVIANMSANDTAAVHVIVSGGSKNITISGAATQSYFSGTLFH